MSVSTSDIKQKAVKGMLWSFIERFGSLLILFTANVVLARMLTPDDFGLVGILMAFVMISQMLIDGGLGNALIQRQKITTVDCSTVFYTNLAVALVCYAALYFGAEAISSFYNEPMLSELIKVLGAVVVIDAFGAVQNNLLMKEVDFKKITIVKVGAALLSSVIAIVAAICGMGVWSLVVQYVVNSVVKSSLLWLLSSWRPILTFSKTSFNTLFKYGSKLLLANLLSEAYRNLLVLIFGKFFAKAEVGYYSQAKHLQDVPVTSIMTIVNQVTFPIFSKLQEDKEQLKRGLSRSVKILTFLNFPLMMGLVIMAEPIFRLLFGEQWIPSVPYFQWLCGGFGFLLVVHNTNINAIKAVGKSGIVLYLEIIKKLLGFGLIMAFIYMGYGAISIMWALAINSFIEFFLNGYFTGKYTGYGIFSQLRDMLPNLMVTAIASAVAYSLTLIDIHYLLLLVAQAISFVGVYLIVMKVARVEIFEYLVVELKTKIKKK